MGITFSVFPILLPNVDSTDTEKTSEHTASFAYECGIEAEFV